MAAALDAKPRPARPLADWVVVGAGLLALYLPVFYNLATGLWHSDDYAHGPIILAVICWLAWRDRASFLEARSAAAPAAGLVLLLAGLPAYMIGRALDISILEIGSLVPVLAGALVALRGWGALRAMWFPLLLVVFLVPLPGPAIAELTGALKQQVSEIAERLLYAFGYPVGRNGVMLIVGQYQLLVADACSGLNSMFSLSALGLLYLHLMQRPGLLHNLLVVASILPIAFCANIIRVLTLVLVTYHFGDAAGQGFLHGAAGIVLLLAALLLLLGFDATLWRLLRPRARA
jgi:exosortase B